MRTPYGKQTYHDYSLLHAAVARGYAFVVQDVRGRYTSDGEFDPLPAGAVRWLRRRRMGRGAALVERPGLDRGPVVSGRGAVAGSGRGAAAPGVHLSGDVLLVGPPVHLLRRRVRSVLDSLGGQQHRARRAAPPRPDGARAPRARRARRGPASAATPTATCRSIRCRSSRSVAPFYFEWLDHPDDGEYLAIRLDRVGPRSRGGARVQPERLARRGLRAGWCHAQLQRRARARAATERSRDTLAAPHRPVDARRSLAAAGRMSATATSAPRPASTTTRSCSTGATGT